jgi:broad specificity phosphatase PhoE
MTAIYLIRHPETTWNAVARYQGRLESALSPRGEQQADRLAHAFGEGELDMVVSSPLTRARALAGALGGATGAPIVADQRLTEMAQGAWEGLYLVEIMDRFTELYHRWYTRPDLVCFPGGEDLLSVRRRAISAIGDVYTRWPDGHVAVVTHSVVIQTVVATALHLDLRDIHLIRVSNAGITTLCGRAAPGSVLTLNELAPLHRSPVASAVAQDCARWEPRRLTS